MATGSMLLATKVRIPPSPHGAVSRPRLSDGLEGAIARAKLTLLAAPAGYGKTTLLAQWARASRFPIAWLSIDSDDSEPDRFLRYLFAAWHQVRPAVMESPLGLLLSGQSPDGAAVLEAFIHVAAASADPLVFVLDDYHLIHDSSVHDALTYLLDHLPPTVHVVLGTRAEPPLPLARYRARHELLEMRAAELQLTQDEAGAFLRQRMGLELSHDEVASLHAQLEGWVAGLQLAGLTIQRREAGAATPTVHGRHRFIADYLRADVLDPLPTALRSFLLRTSFLERLCGSLCDAVLEEPASQEMLELLERENLFLTPLDDERVWFRYHPLFADFLQEELRKLKSAEEAALHCRAAGWYAAHDMPDEAFQHAVAGHDRERVIQIAEDHLMVMITRGEYRIVQRWLELLPEAWFAGYPLFGLVQAGLLAFAGKTEAAARCIDDVEQGLVSWAGAAARAQFGRVQAIRCALACMYNNLTLAEHHAGQAMAALAPEDGSFRALLNGALGDIYRRHGRWGEARARYLVALNEEERSSNHEMIVPVLGGLADLDLRQGHLRQAAAYWREALAILHEPATWGRVPLPVSGWVHIRLGEILYEWGRLQEAREHLLQGIERAELAGDVRAVIAGYLCAGRLKLTESDLDGARGYLEQARPLVEQTQFREWAARFQRLQVEMWIAQGSLRPAVEWAEERLAMVSLDAHPETEAADMAVARVLIAQKDDVSVERALALLAGVLRAAEAEGRMGVSIEALALRALACHTRGQSADALVALEQALRLAEPEGYMHLFIDLGMPMGLLLQAARSRHVMPETVARLLAAFSGETAAAGSAVSLPEPLTERELEVLSLLAAGLTNREIAEKLVISPETVKKHSANIYGKVGASNRTEAVARARTLALLD